MNARTYLFRPATDADADSFLPLLVRDPASALTAEDYQDKLDDAQYRLEWTWLAVDESSSEVVAVAVWWGSPGEPTPGALDAICVAPSAGPLEARIELAADLLKAAHRHFLAVSNRRNPPEYHVFVPGDWHDREDLVSALSWRREAARRAGLDSLLERLRFEWRTAAGVPAQSGRLVYREEPDDEVFVDLFRRTLEGSLDATTTAEASEIGAEAQARSDVEFYRDVMLGERTWWRVAETPEGEPVGFGLPSRNPGFPVVGYLGVLPEHRGKGYGDDILAEITRILAEDVGVEVIRSDTDLANRPMAAAMERAGYVNFARRLVFSAAEVE